MEFQASNPQIQVEAVPKGNVHPYLEAEYSTCRLSA